MTINLNEICTLPHTGLLFVGDPHIWSLKPGRRRDNYLDAICRKLEQIAHISNHQNLWVVILGDLFHHSQDNDLEMISRLTRIFSLFARKPIVLVGNHDLTEHVLTPGTTLDVFHSSGQILTIIDNGPFAHITLGEKDNQRKVLIGGTPYGQEIPASLTKWYSGKTHETIKKKAKADDVVWITHDDFAFDSSYPNAKPLKEILGCDIAVNGHMHRSQKPLKSGLTAWYNPGNISRISIDLLDQDVAVWKWTPGLWQISGNDLEIPLLEKIVLEAADKEQVMSLEGHIAKTSKTPAKEDSSSKFVAQLKMDTFNEKTDEAVFLRETLDEAFSDKETPQHVINIINRLFEKAIQNHQKGKA